MAGILMRAMPALDKRPLELKDKDQQIEKLLSRLENLTNALAAEGQLSAKGLSTRSWPR